MYHKYILILQLATFNVVKYRLYGEFNKVRETIIRNLETINFQFIHVDSSPYDYAIARIQFLVASLNANGCKALHKIIMITMNINADISSDLQNLFTDCL